MRKEDFLSIVVYLLMIVVAIFIGELIISPAFATSALNLVEPDTYIFAISTIVVGLLINTILFEVGHVLGALIGGYKVISVTVLGFSFYKTKNKWRFGFKRYEGLTGETKIVARKEKTRPRLFLFGPTLMVLLEFGIATALFLSFGPKEAIHHQSLIVAGIGAMLLLYNIMPFKLDNFTDGYYIVLLGRKINKEAYNELIRIESRIHEGEDIGEIKTFEEVTTLTARVTLYTLYRLIDEGKFKEALEIIERLIADDKKIELEFVGRIKAQKIYLLLHTKAMEVTENYWFNELSTQERRFISNDLTFETMRSYFLYSGLVTKSESECLFVLNRLKRAERLRLNEYREEEELKLFKEAVLKVRAENPTWELNYDE
ncbi:MAG TPA: hypothetical protein VFD05_03420 [Bacilli bacterium]|nr:hypothetical protein [Bacilli bacterium]